MPYIPVDDTNQLSFIELVKRIFNDIKIHTNNEYLKRKFLTYRLQTFWALILMAFLAGSSWFFDYSLNPNIAKNLILPRLGFVWVLFPALILLRTSNHKLAGLIIVATFALGQIQVIAILRQIPSALTLWSAGFLIFPFVVVILCTGLSFLLTWALLIYSTIVPLILYLNGWIPDFLLNVYLSAVCPGVVIMAIFSANSASGYHKRYILERALENASNTDPLTCVANRRHFHFQLQLEMSRSLRMAHPCALLMLDIDHFKRINDTFGHPTGDLAIKAMADVCTANSRDIDVVARLGGEEFAILAPETNLENARHLAERIRAQVQELKILSEGGEEVSWTVSIGIASLQLNAQTDLTVAKMESLLITSADAALYEAKNTGRNRVMIRSGPTVV